MSVYADIYQFGKGYSNAERDTYADFLDEASLILGKAALREAAQQFRASAAGWQDFGPILLPDAIPMLGEVRQLMDAEHRLFLEQGNASLAERQQIRQRLTALKEQAATDFPLNEQQVTELLGSVAEHVWRLHDWEETAVSTLQHAMN